MTTNAPLSAPDPIFRPLPSAGSTFSTSSKSVTLGLLSQAFPGPEAAQHVYSQKLEYRPLSIIPADTPDARELRGQRRLSRLKRKRKPRPLSAKEKRELRIFEIPKADIRFFLSLPPCSQLIATQSS